MKSDNAPLLIVRAHSAGSQASSQQSPIAGQQGALLADPVSLPAVAASPVYADGGGSLKAARVDPGNLAAMTALDAGSIAADKPGLVPPPLLPSSSPPLIPPQFYDPPEGFSISPDAGKPSVVSAPKADPMPTVLSGTPSDGSLTTAGTVLARNRNEGLDNYPGLRTNTDRYRRAAEVADPDVTGALPSSDWRGHHLIPVQVIKDNLDVFGPASKAEGGFKTDESGNMAALPKNSDAQDTLRDKGIDRPIHDNGHPTWNDTVNRRLQSVKEQLREEGLTPSSPDYGSRATELLRNLEIKLRQELPSIDRLTENVDLSSAPPKTMMG